MLFNLLAAANPDDIFKSMGDSMGAEVNPAQILAILASIVGLCVLISVFKKRADRAPRKSNELNNPSKLLRQVAKEAGLSRGEVKELKKLAQLQGVENPLTLLLCPSLMQAAIAKRKAGNA
jgi:hypothetical protein